MHMHTPSHPTPHYTSPPELEMRYIGDKCIGDKNRSTQVVIEPNLVILVANNRDFV